MRRLHIVLLAWCWALLSASVPASASVSAPRAEACPSEDLCTLLPLTGGSCAVRQLSEDLRSLLPAEFAAPEAPAAGVPAACVDRAAAEEWLCERACNSDMALPRSAGELAPPQGLSAAPRSGAFADSQSQSPTGASGVRRAAAYRSLPDSRSLSGAGLPVRFRRLLI